MAEQGTHNPLVAGSSPAGPTTKGRACRVAGDDVSASRSERGRERRTRRHRAIAIVLAVATLTVAGLGASVFGQGLVGMLGLRGAAVAPPLAASTARAQSALPGEVGRVEIPDVRGMALLQAQAMLEAAGVSVRVNVDFSAASSSEQRVRAQRPDAGSVVSPGASVDLNVPPKDGQPQRSAARTGKARAYVVAIDPGHQSKESTGTEPVGPGAGQMVARATRGGIGRETEIPEYEFARQLAASLEDRLMFVGVKVVMTRSTNDVDLSAAQRAEVANSAKADLLVEIHVRCDESPTGVRTYYPAPSPWTKGTVRASQRAADAIQRSVVAATGAGDAGTVATSDVVGFNWSKVPCVCVEAGSIANPVEERLLSSARYQDRVVEGLANGISEYMASSR
jgi:N-acetylmuramoyl-L-alanine amidase